MAGDVLILGGGIGGVVAANALRRRLPREHRIVLVDREPSFTLAASFLWVMTGARTPAQVSRPLARLARKGIEVVRGEVERIDPERREVVVSGVTRRGDQLVVALGAEFSLDAIPGLAEAGHTFCTLDGAERLREELPRAGVFAHGQAEVVAGNIARALGGKGPEARFDGHGSCFIETGDGLAGYGGGDFYGEPRPEVTVRRPRRFWHAGKVLLEKRILWGWF